MQLEDYFDFSDPDEIRLNGHRVWIQHILRPYIERGESAEQIARNLPSLSLDKVYATILYYLLNKEALTKYMANLDAELERQRQAQPPPSADFLARYNRLKAEMQAKSAGAHEPEVSSG